MTFLKRLLAPLSTGRTRAASLGAMLFVAPLGFIACPGNSAPQNANAARTETVAATTASTANAPAETASVAKGSAFDGERAMAHARKQIALVPGAAGTPELARTRDYIVGELKSYGLNVSLDEFRAVTPVGERRMANIIAEIPGEQSDIIMLSSHYDTKFIKQFRFVGANDPAASVATLLELARVLAANKQKPKFTYRIVFFDGEEAFCFDWEQCHNPDKDGKPTAPDNTYGSRHYVAQLIDKNEVKRIRVMILLDMMGYKNLELGRDDMSTPWLVDIVWQTAREMNYGAQFVDRPEGVGGDDHEPFLRAGIDSLDIIQLSTYPYWHKPEDTLDKISARSMKTVGDVLLASLPRIEQRISSRSR
ncbi:MAG: M28 family metallopeptidase [Pyrinomonadaceae bacterium]